MTALAERNRKVSRRAGLFGLSMLLLAFASVPLYRAFCAATGFDAFSGPPETLASFVQSELVNWGKLIKDAGIEPQ